MLYLLNYFQDNYLICDNNKNGPNIDPCGTPISITSEDDLILTTLVLLFL